MLGDGSNQGPKLTTQHSDILLHSSSVRVLLTLADPTLYLYGFSKSEYAERPPAIIRGSLTIQVYKPIKLKAINLKFSGVCRTEWPEGIPPEKTETCEVNEVFANNWEFFNAQTAEGTQSSCAHEVRPLAESDNNLSSVKSTNALEAMTSVVTRGRSSTLENSNSTNSHPQELKHYRVFQPAEYVYNIELLVPQRMPETIKANFGSVRWMFHLNIERHGTFRSNWSVSREIRVLRALGMSNLETSEPIVISRDWEDLLHYEIVIAGKAFSIGSDIPIAISLLPLAKVKCHRIRAYITEHVEYYCKNRRVHRVEPAHKFLLMEESAKDRGSSLLQFDGGLSRLTEIERTVQIPKKMTERRDVLRPNSNTEYIRVHHWIKIVMRLSRLDAPSTESGRTKCYEISIDSPITLIDKAVESANMLPAYGEPRSEPSVSTELRSYKEFVDESDARPIYFMRQPSYAPPPFDADSAPPDLPPPEYDIATAVDYDERYHAYLNNHRRSGGSEASSSTDDSASTQLERISAESRLSDKTPPAENTGPASSGQPRFSEIIWRTDNDSDPHVGKEQVEEVDDDDPLSTVPAPDPPSPPSAQNTSPIGVSPSPPNAHLANLPLHISKNSIPGWSPLSAGNASRLSSARIRGVPISSPGPSRRPSSTGAGIATPASYGSGAGSGRYYRQSSIVSIDLADQQGNRQMSRVSGITPLPGWYPLSRNNSSDSLGISISEYQGENIETPPSRDPLLGSIDSNGDMGAQYGDWDLEDDDASIISGYYNIAAS